MYTLDHYFPRMRRTPGTGGFIHWTLVPVCRACNARWFSTAKTNIAVYGKGEEQEQGSSEEGSEQEQESS